MTQAVKVISGGIEYSREDLLRMDPSVLRSLLCERVHHNIEVPFYPTFLKWRSKPIADFGRQAQAVFDVWKERGLPEDDEGIDWVKQYLAIAGKVRAGEKPQWTEPQPVPFSPEEMAVVHKLIYGRHSIRDWLDKPVSDEMIDKVLEAGRAAPVGCNLCEVRFIVIRDAAEARMVWSDISTKNAVLIVICYDTRIPKVVGQDRSVPQNAGFDAAAAADHMLLMAHALGLGGCWLSKTSDSAARFKQQYGLSDHLEVALHIAVGWPAMGTLKSKRRPLKEMMFQRPK